jgi:UDP-N-acetylglucosamine 2-epimerase (non-hydrolysing)
MPEEINRLLTDQLSDLLFTTEESALTNLTAEGIAREKIHFVGNVMIDTLLTHLDDARALGVPAQHGLTPGGYAVLTLHRPSNVDDDRAFERLMTALAEIARDTTLVFPVHPRTRPVISRSAGGGIPHWRWAVAAARSAGVPRFPRSDERQPWRITDSGGIQEETTVLGIACLTMRENTERPVTISHGTNRLVGTDPDRIVAGWRAARDQHGPARVPPLWDGHAASRIVEVLRREAGERDGAPAADHAAALHEVAS